MVDIRVLIDLLWRHPLPRANQAAALRDRPGVECFGDPQVDHPDMPVGLDHDVLRFEVAMDKALVNCSECISNLPGDIDAFLPGNRAGALYVYIQCGAVNERHNQEPTAVFFAAGKGVGNV